MLIKFLVKIKIEIQTVHCTNKKPTSITSFGSLKV